MEIEEFRKLASTVAEEVDAIVTRAASKDGSSLDAYVYAPQFTERQWRVMQTSLRLILKHAI